MELASTTNKLALAVFALAVTALSASAQTAAKSSDCVARAAATEGRSGTTTIETAKLLPGNPKPALPVLEPRLFSVSVVVDTTGRADVTTLSPPPGLDSATVDSLRSVLPGWHFSPAHVGACPVKQVVKLKFSR